MTPWNYQGTLRRKDAFKWAQYWSGRLHWSVRVERAHGGLYNVFLKFPRRAQ